MGKRANRIGTSSRYDGPSETGRYVTASGTARDIAAAARRPSPVGDDPAALEGSIEQTRAEISETVEAIQDRLAPEQLTGQAKDTAHEVVDLAIREAKAAVYELTGQAKEAVRDATVGRVERMATTSGEAATGFGSTVVTTIKQNPGPAALTALGIGWLVVNGSSASSSGDTGQYPRSSSDEGAMSQVQEQASQLAGDAQGKASNVSNQVQETASEVSGQVKGAASTIANQAQQKAGQAAEQAQRVPNWFKRMADEHPMPLGVAAVALGSVAAFALPETRRENQLLGQARDSVVDQAQATAEQGVKKAQSIAGEAQEAAEKEAKYQGLSGSE